MAISEIVRDRRELHKLLKNATGLKVYEAPLSCYSGFNVYRSIVQEYREETNAHITVAEGSWCSKNGGEYKISLYTPTLLIGERRKLNIQYIRDLYAKIVNALDGRFGSEAWSACNEESKVWIPLSRNSFYLQIPNFNQKIIFEPCEK